MTFYRYQFFFMCANQITTDLFIFMNVRREKSRVSSAKSTKYVMFSSALARLFALPSFFFLLHPLTQ